MTPEEIRQVRERCEQLKRSTTYTDPEHLGWGGQLMTNDIPALLAHIATLEARNEAMVAVVVAARTMATTKRWVDWHENREFKVPYLEDIWTVVEAIRAFDAQQVGEVVEELVLGEVTT